jgi:uncharacterized delta-60 repeat protein
MMLGFTAGGRYGRHMPGAGDIDTSFGGNGKKTITFGGVDAAEAVLVQPDGRIVVAGGGGAAASTFCVARLRPDGKLDTTFGPVGKRRIAFGGDQEAAFGAALQPDGKIVLAGDSDFRVAVARLNPNGTLDTTFSGDGKRTFSWGPISRAQAAVVMPNGKLLLAGFSGPETGNVQVARLRANGALDGTFGVAGIAKVDFGARPTGASSWWAGRCRHSRRMRRWARSSRACGRTASSTRTSPAPGRSRCQGPATRAPCSCNPIAGSSWPAPRTAARR